MNVRKLSGKWAIVIRVALVLFVVFILWTCATRPLPFMQHRALFVFFGMGLAFALYSCTKSEGTGRIPWFDLVLILLVGVACINIALRQDYYLMKYATVDEPFEHVAGLVLTILILEAGRRTVGWVFPIMMLAMLAYTFLGSLIPGTFGHPGMTLKLLLQNLYQSAWGIWGVITGIMVRLVAIFLIFGALLQYTGGGKTFIELAQIVAGRFRGGPAMVAVLSSAMFGTMSGSVIANVATTGAFTIPLMKRLGYKADFAGAVEAAASTGGNIMPPIMGSAAFIMAELLGVRYIRIAIAAAVPAVLYFISVLSMVRLQAVKANLAPLPKEEIPPARQVLTWGKLAPLFGPVITLVAMLFLGFSADRCALYAIAVAVVIYLTIDFSPAGWMRRLKNIAAALEKGGATMVQLVPLLVCAQIFIALVSLSGLTPKVTAMILGFAGENLWLALILTALIALILGMGLPCTAAYVLVAGVVSFVLIGMGVPPLNAHMFILYFATISAITPPVCTAAFTAASIANASWWRIGFIAVRLALVAYVMPFLFVYNPVFLLQGEPLEIFLAVVTAIIGVVLVSSSLVGLLNSKLFVGTRVLFLAAGTLFFIPGLASDGIAVALSVVGFLVNFFALRIKS